MSSLSMFLFGPPRIELGGHSVQVDSRKAIALLIYLAVTGKSHRRDRLATLLWPEYDQTRARTALRRNLSVARKVLSGEWLTANRETIGLNRSDDLWIDVDRFRNLLAEPRTHNHPLSKTCSDCLQPLTQAVDLYQDDFLAGFTLQDSPDFDDWQMSQAQSLSDDLAATLEKLVGCHQEKNELDSAIAYARRWLSIDPVHEQIHRRLMESYALSGKRSDALRQYEDCVRILKEKLGTFPQEETTRLYQAIKENRLQEAKPRTPKFIDNLPNNLPIQLTSFIGREREIEEVKGLLSTSRLITLTGAGGCGKTRLALKIAADLLEEYMDGVWLMEMAPLKDPNLVPQAIASVLSVSEKPDSSLMDTLSDYLKPKGSLLVIDNCEHMIEACAELAEALLQVCPYLKIMATSREGLGIGGEIQWSVSPLSLPDLQYLQSVEVAALTHYEAIKLFIDRASTSLPDFKVTHRNVSKVAGICHRLDGIPLAIELAAALVKVLSVEQILTRLDDRFRLLTGGSRTTTPHQQTLAATTDWSYNLLSQSERVLLNRLSVFAGGFTLEAAETICTDTVKEKVGIRPNEILALLTHLVNKSLVLVEEAPSDEGISEEDSSFEEREGEVRYRLLETIRQYAQDKLLEAGEGLILRGRHLKWAQGLAEQAEPELQGPDQGSWLERLEREHDNLREALRWAEEKGETEAGLRLGGALWRFWLVRGHLSEGRKQLASLIAPSEASTPTEDRAKVLTGVGTLAHNQGDYAASRSFYEESLGVNRESGNKEGIATTLNNLGWIAWRQGDYAAAHSLSEESLDLHRELGDKRGTSLSLNNLGYSAQFRGNFSPARSFHEESLLLQRELGDKRGIAFSLNNLGWVVQKQGDYKQAAELLEEALTLFREVGEKQLTAFVLSILADVVRDQVDYGRATVLLEESVPLFREIGDKWGIAFALSILGKVGFEQGDYGRATTLLEKSLAIRREIEDKWGIAASLNYLGNVIREQGDYEQASRFYEESLDLRREIGDKYGITECLVGLAGAARADGRPESAAQLLGAAESLRQDIDVPLSSFYRDEYDKNVATLRSALGHEEFERAWAEGKAMSLEQAIAVATQS